MGGLCDTPLQSSIRNSINGLLEHQKIPNSQNATTNFWSLLSFEKLPSTAFQRQVLQCNWYQFGTTGVRYVQWSWYIDDPGNSADGKEACRTVVCKKQGKSEGFESCDRPIVRKCRIWVKIGDVLSPVTLKSDGWPWKTIGHLFFAVSSFVQHFIAIGAFKLELQSGNAQFGSNSTIFRAMWPWKLTDDLEKQ